MQKLSRILGYFDFTFAIVGGAVGAAVSILGFNLPFVGLVLCVLGFAAVFGFVGKLFRE